MKVWLNLWNTSVKTIRHDAAVSGDLAIYNIYPGTGFYRSAEDAFTASRSYLARSNDEYIGVTEVEIPGD